MSDSRRVASLRAWAPALGVAAAILVLTLGARVVSSAVRDATGQTVGVDGVATIDPPDGWTEDLAARRDENGARTFVLTKGSAVVAVTVIVDAGVDLPTLAAAYDDGVLDARFLELAKTDPQPVSVGGLPGVRTIYVGRTSSRTDVEGVVTVAVGPGGAGLVIDGAAPEGLLASVAEDLEAMAEGARIA
jgi:hypothetical protein